eukprot:TRINITY_DN3778_c11_g1_i1.p1 TRINITY_DN3778_c11_g1~~TRINITY_DN3778_c11_g1_i1.p1  ORF type:complete len:421 (+),score=45.27 TRINITY_DN3778_c11_g1_i1:27-1265(+)
MEALDAARMNEMRGKLRAGLRGGRANMVRGNVTLVPGTAVHLGSKGLGLLVEGKLKKTKPPRGEGQRDKHTKKLREVQENLSARADYDRLLFLTRMVMVPLTITPTSFSSPVVVRGVQVSSATDFNSVQIFLNGAEKPILRLKKRIKPHAKCYDITPINLLKFNMNIVVDPPSISSMVRVSAMTTPSMETYESSVQERGPASRKSVMVCVQNVSGLADQGYGEGDMECYVKITLNGVERMTRVVKTGFSPVFNEQLAFHNAAPSEAQKIEVHIAVEDSSYRGTEWNITRTGRPRVIAHGSVFLSDKMLQRSLCGPIPCSAELSPSPASVVISFTSSPVIAFRGAATGHSSVPVFLDVPPADIPSSHLVEDDPRGFCLVDDKDKEGTMYVDDRKVCVIATGSPVGYLKKVCSD